MKQFLSVFLFLVILTPSAFAQITINAPYAYGTVSAQKNGVVFFEIQNESGEDRLIGVTQLEDGSIAERVEMHTHTTRGEMMMMREVDGYEVPARDTVKLEPMGHHIMLIGLKEPLRIGRSFPLMLHFARDGERLIHVGIIPPGTKPQSDDIDPAPLPDLELRDDHVH